MKGARFAHVGFTVSDIDRSVGWYSHFLDREPLVVCKGWDKAYTGAMLGYEHSEIDWAYFQLPGGGELELVRYVDPPTSVVDMETNNVGNGHLCIVVEDIHAEYERLGGFAKFRSEAPIRIPSGPNVGGWGAYLRDPDGISIQLMQPPRVES